MESSGSVSLPNINRASSENSIFYAGVSTKGGQGDQNRTTFEKRIDRMSALDFPATDAAASVKGRIIILETCADVQSDHNKQTQQSFLAAAKNLEDVDGNIKSLLLNMQSDFDLKLATMKKEYDHRFDLQASENKRLQSHVASLKSDTNQLKRKMQSTIEKLRKLQHEFGDPDDIEEESSVFFSPNNSMELGSRPNTGTF